MQGREKYCLRYKSGPPSSFCTLESQFWCKNVFVNYCFFIWSGPNFCEPKKLPTPDQVYQRLRLNYGYIWIWSFLCYFYNFNMSNSFFSEARTFLEIFLAEKPNRLSQVQLMQILNQHLLFFDLQKFSEPFTLSKRLKKAISQRHFNHIFPSILCVV